jgi:hypothetical protein
MELVADQQTARCLLYYDKQYTQLDASNFQITNILYQIPAEFSVENPLRC